ncbi:ABC transporter substrate-binding protein [Caldiplasma sukawensis]
MRDFRNREVKIPDKINTIISLNPSITETLFLIGMGEKVKGVSAFCRRPSEAEKVRKIGSYSSINKNIVDEINPDIIFTVSGYQDPLSSDISKEYNVFELELPSSPFGIIDMVLRVGTIVSKYQESISLSKKMISNLPHVNFNLRGYLEIDLGGPVSFGRLSYITSTLNYMGIKTPYDMDLREWIKPEFEQITEFDPEIIIMEGKMFRGLDEKNAYEILNSRGWEEVSAVKKRNVFVTPGKLDFFAHHGPDFFMTTIPWLIDNIKKKLNKPL